MRVNHVKILEAYTKVFMGADAEIGATREQVIKEMEKVFAAIERGDFERIDVEDIDGHLPVQTLEEAIHGK